MMCSSANGDSVHFKQSATKHPLNIKKWSPPEGAKDYHLSPLPHAIWTPEEVQQVRQTHVEPNSLSDKMAFNTVKLLRNAFDIISGYKIGALTENKVLNRAIFLETVAGVPGMAAGMIRHLRSLRTMKRDHGWIPTLLEEAENERMHLMTFIKIKQPGYLFRASVILTQAIFMPAYMIGYLISPKFCHKFVGYLEEQAVKTYTDIVAAIDDGRLGKWQTQKAPLIGQDYWQLGPEGTMRDLILAIRADEANHRDVNHIFSGMHQDQDVPFEADNKVPKNMAVPGAQQQQAAGAA